MKGVDWDTFMINEEDYFYEPDENGYYSIESIPKFDSAVNYIESNKRNSIINTRTEIKDCITFKTMVFKEIFWNKQNNKICGQEDFDGKKEIIITMTIKKFPERYQIIRMEKVKDFFEVVYYTITEEDQNGFEIENRNVLTGDIIKY